MMETPVKPRLTAALIPVFAVFATACAHVGQEEIRRRDRRAQV